MKEHERKQKSHSAPSGHERVAGAPLCEVSLVPVRCANGFDGPANGKWPRRFGRRPTGPTTRVDECHSCANNMMSAKSRESRTISLVKLGRDWDMLTSSSRETAAGRFARFGIPTGA